MHLKLNKKRPVNLCNKSLVKLIQKQEKIPKSSFGTRSDLKSFSKQDRADFHEY